MKQKSILLVLMALIATGSLWAKPVDQQRAQQVGTAWLRAMGCANAKQLSLIETPYAELYVFAAERQGFVIVSADDCVRPILGYSATATFPAGPLPQNVDGWLEDYAIAIQRVAARYAELDKQQATVGSQRTEAVAAQWRQLEAGIAPQPLLMTAVNPLLTTTWNQSPYYNDLCPYDSTYGERVVTGCVATATAQIMKFWNHPATGYGSHSYDAYSSQNYYGTLSANFGATTYQWATMPAALTSVSSQAEINAVATLMLHVGIADEMSYDVSANGGSGANNYSYDGNPRPSSQFSLMSYFKYRPDMAAVARDDYNDSTYSALLRAELDQNRPILYSGRNTSGGHSFVCDGYDDAGMFHINWGWGGSRDGYFYMGSLNPGVGGTGGNSTGTYNVRNVAMTGIRPNPNFGTGGTVSTTVSSGSGTVSGAGTYNFGDTVSLYASAAEGYRFAGWSDNSLYNPRTFVMNGGDYTFTARFEALSSQGDTMGYCGGANLTSFGTGNSGNDTYWGIRLPATSLTVGNQLTAVQFYAGYAGTYDVTVITGTTSPTDTVATVSVSVTNTMTNDWCTAFLDQPYTVEASKSVWLVMHNYDLPYPAALSYGSGNEDGFLWGQSLYYVGWDQYSVMLRGLFNVDPILATGDTVSYCGNADYEMCWGMYTHDYKWGIMVPAAQLAGRNYLKSVMLYVGFTGNYTMQIYRGGNDAPATLVHTQPYTTEDFGWNEIALDATVALDTTSNLWIVFSAPDLRWPAAICAYTGMSNSDWYTTGGNSWGHMSADGNMYSWMIKAVTSATVPALPAPTVAIDRVHYTTVGTATTFTATATTGTTPAWTFPGATPATATGLTATTTWNTTGYYTVKATVSNSHGTGTDSLWVMVEDCNNSTSIPYTQNFEAYDNTLCLGMADNDNDGQTWVVNHYNGYSNERCITSVANSSAVDNWLFMPKLYAEAGSHFTIRWYDNGGYGQHYGVYIDTTAAGTATANYIQLAEYTLSNNYWTERSIDLSRYAGRTFRIAFRHYNAASGALHIDYVRLLEDFYVEGSTLSYCGNNPISSPLGNGGTMQWGIMLPASRLMGYDTLTSVQLYVLYAGSYTLNIASGSIYAPGTPVVTKTVNFGEEQTGWQTIVLDNPLPIASLQPLWITFASPLSYPATYCYYTGDPNSNWATINGTDWRHMDYWGFNSTWMIKADMTAGNGCGIVSLPYTADYTQCWTATGGATIIDNNHVSINSYGQQLTSPWIELPQGRTFIEVNAIRDYSGNWWWSDDSLVFIDIMLEDADGETVAEWDLYSNSSHGNNGFEYAGNGGPHRLTFRYTSTQAAHLLHLSDLVLYTYPISLTYTAPSTANVGDTVTITAIPSLPAGDTVDYWYWSSYFNHQWIDNDDSSMTILASTNNSRTVVFHSPGIFEFQTYINKYNVYQGHSANAYNYVRINVHDTVTVDCDNISLPYTADFTQCWTAENGATIIDPTHAAITTAGQTLISPWMESMPGKTFLNITTQREGNVNHNTEWYDVEIESWTDGEFTWWRSFPYPNNSTLNNFVSPGGRIRVLITYTGTAPVPSLQISNVMLYQYQIDVTLDAPGIVNTGDTVTLTAHATLQNGDRPDSYSFYMWGPDGNGMDDSDPRRTIIARTDSSLTVVWNTAGRYGIHCDVNKYNIYQGNFAYAYTNGTINVTDHTFYVEDSIYYTSAAKDTVIGCHHALHNALLPESVRVINDSAFYHLANLATVAMPDGLQHIGKNAFEWNDHLTELTLPRGLQFIGDNAFASCYNLHTVHFNADSCLVVSPTTESDGSYWPAFIGCYNIHTITVGDNVKRIPSRIFWGCYGLRGTLVIPDAVTYIGEDAFTGWNNNWTGEDGDTLSIVLSRNLTEIGNYAFGAPFGKLRTVYARNPEPPTIYASTFYVQDATLVVPCGKLRTYARAEYWNEFQHFVENCESIDELDADEVRILTTAEGIVVEGALGEDVVVYDITGREVAATVNRGGVIGIQHTGTYLVKVGSLPAQRVVVMR